jgi:hypothetical protein
MKSMADATLDRREFLSFGARVCGACACSGLATIAWAEQERIDPAKLNYCGYTCPEDCKFLQGTLNDDVELKRQAWKAWKIEERFGLEFDPDQAICYGCKAVEKPEGVVVSRCDVRACARGKELDCCIECDELTACDKDLWRRFPKFKEQVIAMQEAYRAQA